MNDEKLIKSSSGKFHLSKWFLDFIGESGDAMIFYAAKLKWHGWSVSYASWLRYDRASGVRLKSRFNNIQIPKIQDDKITWKDARFGVSGTWEPLADMIQTRIFDSEEGSVDWKCFQPASKVQVRIKEKVLNGRGYAEQLILTVPPWRIPMEQLRWGRFGSDEINLVWIELRDKEKRQWLWLNGKRIENCIVEDDQISLPEKELVLFLNKGVLLESEKKISSLAQKIIRYMPGVNKLIPVNFLTADEFKWLSEGEFKGHNNTYSRGMAIHELVKFKA
ncbi:MAG: hypothetical protein NTW31_11895 [Bacteroidetes bacterium]|nr:hypothetical protein [Bacteroidota bacterium]